MRLLVIISSYLVAVNAWPTGNTMGNMMGNNMGNTNGNWMGSNMMRNTWGNGMFGSSLNNAPGHQNWGYNQGQMWGMAGNYNGAQQAWGSGQRQPSTQAGGQQQSQTMNNNILHLLLGSMLANNMKSGQQWQPQYQQQWQPQQQQWGQWQQEKNMKDMEEIEEMMKKKMMKEIAHLVMYQMELKEKEDAYMDAVKFLCLMVNTTITDARRNNESINNLISDEQMETYKNELENMNDIEKFHWLLKMKGEKGAEYEEIFFRTSAWSCHTAYEYKTAVAKMEKMENDECTTGKMGDM